MHIRLSKVLIPVADESTVVLLGYPLILLLFGLGIIMWSLKRGYTTHVCNEFMIKLKTQ